MAISTVRAVFTRRGTRPALAPQLLVAVSWIVALGASSSLPAAEPARPERLNRTVALNTDVASFFLFEPQALAHRRKSPLGWESYAFAAGRELGAGNMAAFCTGSDGLFRLRITDGGPTPLEQQRSNGSWSFRLKVRHGRLLLDNGEHLPSEETADEREEDLNDLGEQWLALPRGDYQVAVHALARSAKDAARGATRPASATQPPVDYVICFQRIEGIESIKTSQMPPLLDLAPGQRPVEMKSVTEYRRYEEDLSLAVPPQAAALVISTGPLVPGFQARLPVTDAFHEATEGRGPGGAAARIEQVVVVDSVRTPTIGVLAVPVGKRRSDNEPWMIEFAARRLVKVTKLTRGQLSLQAELAPVVRRMDASPRQIDEAKAAFALYARKNLAYRGAIEYPDFEAERIAAMTSAAGVMNLLIHHAQMPADARRRLLALSDAERVRELTSLLQNAE